MNTIIIARGDRVSVLVKGVQAANYALLSAKCSPERPNGAHDGRAFANADHAFPASLETLDNAVEGLASRDIVDYSVKAGRIGRAIKRWGIRHEKVLNRAPGL